MNEDAQSGAYRFVRDRIVELVTSPNPGLTSEQLEAQVTSLLEVNAEVNGRSAHKELVRFRNLCLEQYGLGPHTMAGRFADPGRLQEALRKVLVVYEQGLIPAVLPRQGGGRCVTCAGKGITSPAEYVTEMCERCKGSGMEPPPTRSEKLYSVALAAFQRIPPGDSQTGDGGGIVSVYLAQTELDALTAAKAYFHEVLYPQE